MESSWGVTAVWIGLAWLACLPPTCFHLSVAVVEFRVGSVAGNLALLLDHSQVRHGFGLRWKPWAARFDREQWRVIDVFEQVVAGIDGSPASEKALAAAVDRAALGVSELPSVAGVVGKIERWCEGPEELSSRSSGRPWHTPAARVSPCGRSPCGGTPPAPSPATPRARG